jgi:hypothetical protein
MFMGLWKLFTSVCVLESLAGIFNLSFQSSSLLLSLQLL